MDRASLEGRTLEYEVRGDGEPVVFIHGAHIADAFVPLLSQPSLAKGYRMVVYHRRGFAGSTRPEGPMTFAEQAADCRALLGHLGIERAHVVGHSYGGVIALQLARETPDVVHSLALFEPALLPLVPSGPGFMESMRPLLQTYHAGKKAEAVDAFLRDVVAPDYRGLLDRRLPGAFAQAVSDADTFFRAELASFADWTFTPSDAARIRQPVLAVLGAESHRLWPGWAEIHDLLQTWMPQTEPFVLDGATHGLQLTDPAGAAAALSAFFGRHALPARR